MAETIYGQYPVAKWAVPGAAPVTFPVDRIQETYANRIVLHERPYREGARLEDTYARVTIWQLSCPFFNSEQHEEGVDGLAQYPDNVNALSLACKIHETGTLTIPTVGPRRCRAESYQRIEEVEHVDMALVVFTFWEDNEDDAAAAAAQAPSAQSVAKAMATEAVAASEEVGATSGDLGELVAFAAELEGLAMAPGNFVTDLETTANALSNRAERVHDAFTGATAEAAIELRTLFTDPRASRAGRTLQRLADTSRRVLPARLGHLGRIVAKRFDRDMSIFRVATVLQQPVDDLVQINMGLADFLFIPRGTPVNVFA